MLTPTILRNHLSVSEEIKNRRENAIANLST